MRVELGLSLRRAVSALPEGSGRVQKEVEFRDKEVAGL